MNAKKSEWIYGIYRFLHSQRHLLFVAVRSRPKLARPTRTLDRQVRINLLTSGAIWHTDKANQQNVIRESQNYSSKSRIEDRASVISDFDPLLSFSLISRRLRVAKMKISSGIYLKHPNLPEASNHDEQILLDT